MRCAVDSWVPGLAPLARDTRSSTSRCSGNRVSRDSAEQATGGTMKLPRRKFLHLAAGAAALPALPRIAGAQTYPNRYVRFVVPFPPGGSADPIARVLANRLSEMWSQQVIIENKGGAG